LEGLDITRDRGGQLEGVIRARRLRERYFTAALFADPAWDILLDLYAAHLRGRRVSITSAGIAAHVPGTTALRWITLLEKRGLIFRRADRNDARRYFVTLSDGARQQMENYFDFLDHGLDPGVAKFQPCGLK
jgi:hypothetical protein